MAAHPLPGSRVCPEPVLQYLLHELSGVAIGGDEQAEKRETGEEPRA